jgi:phosphopantetheinyl transferase
MMRCFNHYQNQSTLQIAIMSTDVGSQLFTFAEDYLSEKEMTQFRQCKCFKRKKEWFTARLVSKLLVLNYEDKPMLGETVFEWTPLLKLYKLSDICKVLPRKIRMVTIVKGGHTLKGKPEIYFDGCHNSYLHLSISHTGGWAAASISSLGAIGIDLEECISRSSAFYNDFFTPWEKDWVQRNIEAELTAEKLYTLLWTLKESYYKTGLSPLLRLYEFSCLEVRPLSLLKGASLKLQTMTSCFQMSDLKLEFSHINSISSPKSSFLMMSNLVLSLVAFGI